MFSERTSPVDGGAGTASPAQEEQQQERAGRGGRFFVLDPEAWERLWTVPAANRMNLVLAFLVLLAGTGADHRLTKWSAKACEQHVGVGKPRAKRAIEELIAAGLLERTEASTKAKPQYRLPPLPRDADAVFLPVALVTGLTGETPVLRRVRESGDPLLLRMLVDLYALAEPDAPGGLPLSVLCRRPAPDAAAWRVMEHGRHALWAMPPRQRLHADGPWCLPHWTASRREPERWDAFWARVARLEAMGVLWFEPWLFEGAGLDAEPLAPVDLGVIFSEVGDDDVAAITQEAFTLGWLMADKGGVSRGRWTKQLLMPRLLHQGAPALFGVARLRVEPDTPARRRAWARRMALIERTESALKALSGDLVTRDRA